MRACEIIEKIEEFAPKSLACSWDNPGFLCGNPDKEVNKVLLTLDVDLFSVNEAIEKGADMIISHHPLFFSGLKKIDFSTPEGKIVELLIKNDIAVYAAHTNMDAAEKGINQRLAKMFELQDVKVLEPMDETCGIGRLGDLKEKMSIEDFADLVKEKLNTPFVRVCGGGDIKKLAICSGRGGDYYKLAKDYGCDALLTGDVKYHDAQDSISCGISIIDAGHFPTEKLVCDIFEEILRGLPINLIKSDSKDVFIVK